MRLVLLTCFTFLVAAAASAQCPTLTVIGPPGITVPGEEMKFRAELNVIGPKLSYSWSVDKGTIINGQGTHEIVVLTNSSLAGETLAATVQIDGLPEGCSKNASEIAGIAVRLPCGFPADEYGEIKPNDERGRLDMFFVELSNNPDNIGLLVLRVKAGENLDPINKRIQFVLKHVKFRKFDKSRIWFALEVADERSTKLYRIPPGADPPPCDGCLVFRGESL